jgi:Tfp pilus assembly protein PilN
MEPYGKENRGGREMKRALLTLVMVVVFLVGGVIGYAVGYAVWGLKANQLDQIQVRIQQLTHELVDLKAKLPQVAQLQSEAQKLTREAVGSASKASTAAARRETAGSSGSVLAAPPVVKK